MSDATGEFWVWDCPCGLNGWLNSFIPLGTTARRVDTALVALGMCSSASDAQRLVKSGGVSIRVNDDWVRVKDPREKLLEGWPITIRVGKGHWRLAKRANDESGYQLWPGIETVMIPVEGQTTECWSEIWRL